MSISQESNYVSKKKGKNPSSGNRGAKSKDNQENPADQRGTQSLGAHVLVCLLFYANSEQE